MRSENDARKKASPKKMNENARLLYIYDLRSEALRAHVAEMEERMHLLSERTDSFEHWPPQMKQQPDVLARDGFFFTQIGDIVKCFSCRIQLGRWKADQSVRSSHEAALKLKGKHCPYLSEQKFYLEL